jgi:hypothetical protein
MWSDWDDEEYWWYDKKWALYEDCYDLYEGWYTIFVGYCFGEFEARYWKRRGYLVFEPARSYSWW